MRSHVAELFPKPSAYLLLRCVSRTSLMRLFYFCCCCCSFASCLFTVSVCYPSSNELKHCMRNMEGGIAGHLCFGFFVTEFSPQFSPLLNNSSLRFYMSGTNVTELFDRRLPALQSRAPGFSPPTPGLDLPSPGPGKPTVASHSVVSLYVHFPNIIRYQNQLLQEHSSLTPLVISPLVYGFLIII